MSNRQDTLIVLPEAIPASQLLTTVRQRFEVFRVHMCSEPLVVYNDFEGQEREPEIATSEQEAIHLLTSWPGLGGTEYDLADRTLTLFLLGTKAGLVDALSLSVSASDYMSDQRLQDAYDRLISDL